MIFTDYYKFVKNGQKGKTRIDCTASTQSYDGFEELRATSDRKPTAKSDGVKAGMLTAYYTDVPPKYDCDVRRTPSKSFAIKHKNVSGVYIPDLSLNVGYGDVNGTADAVIFVMSGLDTPNGIITEGGCLEVFIARGQRNNVRQIFTMFVEGEFTQEIEQLRQQAEIEKYLLC